MKPNIAPGAARFSSFPAAFQHYVQVVCDFFGTICAFILSGGGSPGRRGISAMRRTSIAMAFAVTAAVVPLSVHAGSVGYELRKFPGIPVHVVTVNLSSPHISVQAQLAQGGPGHTESFRSMLRRTRPVAAITGAFFDTRSKYPVGDIAVEGELVHRGIIGNGICVTADGRIELVDRAQGVATMWSGYTTVICGGPTLLKESRIVLNPRAEGFSDPGLFGNRKRTAVGLTANNKLKLVSINKPVSLKRLALILEALGCTDAITLDGGSSAGLWYNGRLLSSPSRNLTNVLAVHWTPDTMIARAEPEPNAQKQSAGPQTR